MENLKRLCKKILEGENMDKILTAIEIDSVFRASFIALKTRRSPIILNGFLIYEYEKNEYNKLVNYIISLIREHEHKINLDGRRLDIFKFKDIDKFLHNFSEIIENNKKFFANAFTFTLPLSPSIITSLTRVKEFYTVNIITQEFICITIEKNSLNNLCEYLIKIPKPNKSKGTLHKILKRLVGEI